MDVVHDLALISWSTSRVCMLARGGRKHPRHDGRHTTCPPKTCQNQLYFNLHGGNVGIVERERQPASKTTKNKQPRRSLVRRKAVTVVLWPRRGTRVNAPSTLVSERRAKNGQLHVALTRRRKKKKGVTRHSILLQHRSIRYPWHNLLSLAPLNLLACWCLCLDSLLVMRCF